MARAVTPTNLSPSVQAGLLRNAVFAFAVALGATMAAVGFGLAPLWRGFLFLPFGVASYMLHASLLGTCFLSSLRGVRQTASGMQPVGDPQERAALVRRGAMAFASTVGAAAFGTALAVIAR
ncbi:MAG: hypothetical protein JNL38_22045 [Myxococcales bacterium]|jgi:hypothetical protein|nr:hypothetical protein [Myxococcales bacterium]